MAGCSGLSFSNGCGSRSASGMVQGWLVVSGDEERWRKIEKVATHEASRQTIAAGHVLDLGSSDERRAARVKAKRAALKAV
jgi:hypothetical protein